MGLFSLAKLAVWPFTNTGRIDNQSGLYLPHPMKKDVEVRKVDPVEVERNETGSPQPKFSGESLPYESF